MRLRTLLRYVLAAFAIAFATWLGLQLRGRSLMTGQATDPRTDPNAVVESSGGLITRTRGQARDMDLQHKGLRTYPDGRTVFQSVVVTVPAARRSSWLHHQRRRGGGHQGQRTGPRERSRLADSDRQTDDERAARRPTIRPTASSGSPATVTFTKGTTTGSSIGATYDNTRDVLWMLERAVIDVPPGQGQSETHMRAGSAGFARAERYIRLQDAASVVHDGQTLAGDSITVFMQPAADIIELVELRGQFEQCRCRRRNSCSRWRLPTSTSRTSRTDERCARSRWPRRPRSSSAPQGAAAPADASTASLIDMQLDADGSTMTGLTAQESAQLTVPQAGATPARVISGDTLTGTGQPGRGLTGATFTNNVTFKETRTAGKGQTAMDRTITAETLDLQTRGASTRSTVPRSPAPSP